MSGSEVEMPQKLNSDWIRIKGDEKESAPEAQTCQSIPRRRKKLEMRVFIYFNIKKRLRQTIKRSLKFQLSRTLKIKINKVKSIKS